MSVAPNPSAFLEFGALVVGTTVLAVGDGDRRRRRRTV